MSRDIGLVGSSNNPISGVTVCVVLITALLIRIYFHQDGVGPPATIYVSAMIACAGSISGDNMQDLKTGHIEWLGLSKHVFSVAFIERIGKVLFKVDKFKIIKEGGRSE